MEQTDQILPHSEPVEMQIFASFLTERQVFIDYCGMITPEMFYHSGRSKIFAYMIETQCTDLTILGEKFPNETIMLAECFTNISSTLNLCGHIDILKDRYYRRCLILASEALKQVGYEDFEQTTQQIIDKHVEKILSIQNSYENSRPQRIGEILPAVFNQLEKIYGKIESAIVRTGLIDLDAFAGDFLPTELTVIAGRSSMGKSSMALHIARQNSIQQDLPGLIYSVEMSKVLTASRILFAEANIPYSAIAAKSQKILAPLKEKSNEIENVNLFINDNPRITAQQMAIQAEQYRQIYGIEYIIIDHIQKMTPRDFRRSRHEQITEICNDLSAMAKKLNIPVIAISQLSRAVEMRNPPRPQLSDLRESGSIEEIADKVFMLYRPDYYDSKSDEKGICEIIVGKNRNGPTGKRCVFWDKELMQFKNLSNENTQKETRTEW
jgi:replicative DNA helicase